MQKIVKKSRKYKAFYTLCSRKSPDGKKQSCQKSIKKEDEQKVIFLKFMFFYCWSMICYCQDMFCSFQSMSFCDLSKTGLR